MLRQGDRINEFRLVKRLGNGTFGEAWLAENEIAVGNDPKQVVLKISLRDDEDLLSDASALAVLDHPHIVKLYRPGRTQDGSIFLVMEYMPGGDLATQLRAKSKFSEEEAVPIVSQVLQAVEYLHSKGCLHSDIKPHNILLDADGKIKLSDFGLARFMGNKSHITAPGGAPAYMAPETWKNEARPASDLWSVGIVLHELLTGVCPFQAQTVEGLMYRILQEPPVLSPDLSEEMREFLLVALEKDAKHRYASASVMREALEAAYLSTDLSAAWKKYDLLTHPETVVIVVGTRKEIEIDDRLAASLIQAELLQSGRMAVILTDVRYETEKDQFARCPVIALGGPSSNAVTAALNRVLGIEDTRYAGRGQKVVKVDPTPPAKAVVWGGWAQDTLHAACEFLQGDVGHFLKQEKAADIVIVSPHIDDAFLCLGGVMAQWRRVGKTVSVVNVFSATNFSSFYIAAQNVQQIAAIATFRKIEELTNALALGVQVRFLDFPEGLLRRNAFRMEEMGVLWEKTLSKENERSVIENVKRTITTHSDAEYYFPLSLSQHIDHLLLRTVGVELIKEGKIQRGYLYEDMWPSALAIGEPSDGSDILDTPASITALINGLGFQATPRWTEINPKEAMGMAAVYSAEVADMRGMLGVLRRYSRSNRDGKSYVRYWAV
ncbi:MAG: protein kinase [Deltaproteobacteria bacterium]|nr:protein kinase [Deltaproteobacteria bacterium]